MTINPEIVGSRYGSPFIESNTMVDGSDIFKKCPSTFRSGELLGEASSLTRLTKQFLKEINTHRSRSYGVS